MHDPISELNQELLTATPAERREIIRQLVPTAKRWIVASVQSDAAGSSDAEAAEWADYLWVKLVEPLAVSVGHAEYKNGRRIGASAAATEFGGSPGGS